MGRQPTVPVFPTPSDRYDAFEEGQYRLSVQGNIQQSIGFLTERRTGTPAALGSGDNDDLDIGTVVDLLRLSANAGASAITGISSGRGGRRIVLVNITANTLTLEHEDSASAATNRIITPTAAAITLVLDDVAEIIYDEVSARWRVIGTAV